MADYRVAAPNAAAELVSKFDRDFLLTYLQSLENQMTKTTSKIIEANQYRIHHLINEDYLEDF